jgi:hypothetical protein
VRADRLGQIAYFNEKIADLSRGYPSGFEDILRRANRGAPRHLAILADLERFEAATHDGAPLPADMAALLASHVREVLQVDAPADASQIARLRDAIYEREFVALMDHIRPKTHNWHKPDGSPMLPMRILGLQDRDLWKLVRFDEDYLQRDHALKAYRKDLARHQAELRAHGARVDVKAFSRLGYEEAPARDLRQALDALTKALANGRPVNRDEVERCLRAAGVPGYLLDRDWAHDVADAHFMRQDVLEPMDRPLHETLGPRVLAARPVAHLLSAQEVQARLQAFESKSAAPADELPEVPPEGEAPADRRRPISPLYAWTFTEVRAAPAQKAGFEGATNEGTQPAGSSWLATCGDARVSLSRPQMRLLHKLDCNQPVSRAELAGALEDLRDAAGLPLLLDDVLNGVMRALHNHGLRLALDGESCQLVQEGPGR